jgi:hypothetical protein
MNMSIALRSSLAEATDGPKDDTACRRLNRVISGQQHDLHGGDCPWHPDFKEATNPQED